MSLVPDAERYADLKLRLACPQCEAEGLIPWQHLDRVLYCHGCERLFRVEPHGLVELEQSSAERISVQVRSSSSEWQDHEAVIDNPPGVAARARWTIGDARAAPCAGWRRWWLRRRFRWRCCCRAGRKERMSKLKSPSHSTIARCCGPRHRAARSGNADSLHPSRRLSGFADSAGARDESRRAPTLLGKRNHSRRW